MISECFQFLNLLIEYNEVCFIDVELIVMGKVTLGLLVLGGLFLAIGVWMLSTAYASKNWPVVDGLIEKSKVIGYRSRTGHVVTKSMNYKIQILYAYEVDGKTYRSKRYSLGSGLTVAGPFTDKKDARTWLKQSDFQVNQPI